MINKNLIDSISLSWMTSFQENAARNDFDLTQHSQVQPASEMYCTGGGEGSFNDNIKI
jgi:hypothetical protein